MINRNKIFSYISSFRESTISFKINYNLDLSAPPSGFNHLLILQISNKVACLLLAIKMKNTQSNSCVS